MKPFSHKSTSDFIKANEEFDQEIITSNVQGTNTYRRFDSKINFKDSNNLVTLTENQHVLIDPVKLIFRTKAQTETAKKLENRLEDLFGITVQDLKNKKNKNKKIKSSNGQDVKATELKRIETKKGVKSRLERELSIKMEVSLIVSSYSQLCVHVFMYIH